MILDYSDFELFINLREKTFYFITPHFSGLFQFVFIILTIICCNYVCSKFINIFYAYFVLKKYPFLAECNNLMIHSFFYAFNSIVPTRTPALNRIS